MGAVRDPQDPNNWKWVNGNDVTVSFWNAPGGGEGCARFDGSKGWLWADTECEAKLNYICQHRKYLNFGPQCTTRKVFNARDIATGYLYHIGNQWQNLQYKHSFIYLAYFICLPDCIDRS